MQKLKFQYQRLVKIYPNDGIRRRYPYHNYPAKYYMTGLILSISILTDQKNFFANHNVDYAKATVVVAERSNGAKQKISNIRYENIGVPNHIQFNFDNLKLNVIYMVSNSAMY